MSDLGLQRVGPTIGGSGTAAPFRADVTGAQAVTDAHGRYAEAVRRGNVWFLNATAVAPTAFTGGAGGVPILAVMNPLSSGKNMELLGISISPRVQASATGMATFSIWGGVSANPTG